ncbi:MAG: nucleotidyltransferase family protein [Lachnospiraceae bacterium]|nr:nucleotidyltransferase family protein [Lachnospiraceae bacterium]
MKTAGIIAEFNPFHNGHEHLISEAKSKYGADHCVIVMSGSFTQRGEPAWMYKYDRVKCALISGADVVLELPVSYATAGAEAFAFGGVSILHAIGITDILIFGTENDDITSFEKISEELLEPSEEYKEALNEGLKKGLSYPAARCAALPDHSDILSSPNNILGIEYLKSLRILGSEINPIAVKRMGNGYHDDTIMKYASAEAIRKEISQNNNIENIKGCVPDSVYDIMSDGYKKTYPLTPDDLTLIAAYTMLSSSFDELSSYQDVNPDIANRLLKGFNINSDKADHPLTETILSMKTKELTYTRLSRSILHSILRQKDMTRTPEKALIPCPYTRLLGFKESSSDLMHNMVKKTAIPIINKAADADSALSEEALNMFNATIRADRLYDLLIKNKYGTCLTDSCRISPIIL